MNKLAELVEQAQRPMSQVSGRVTRNEKQRLDALCEMAGVQSTAVVATAVRGAIAELQEIVDAKIDPDPVDAPAPEEVPNV